MKRNAQRRLQQLEQRRQAVQTPSYIAVASEYELGEAFARIEAAGGDPSRCKVYVGGISPDNWPNN